MNCAAHIVKYILFLLNFAFVCCGILLIAVGSILLASLGEFKAFDDAVDARTLPILIIFLGCVVFVVAFFGCCGALRESVCCMTVYSVFMIILFILQLALVIWMFVHFQSVLNKMTHIVDQAWKYNDEANGYPMNELEVTFKCCGYISYQDYVDKQQPIPASCCGNIISTTACTPDIYTSKPGCQDKFYNFWLKHANIVRYAGIFVALVELVVIIFACCLTSSIRKSR